MKLRTNLSIAFIIIGLTISLSSLAFAQSSKKKSKTPPVKASGTKIKTAGLSQGTFSSDVTKKDTKKPDKKTNDFQTTSEDLQSLKDTKKTTNLGGEDDPEKTQRSSKANNSKDKTAGYAEYEEIAVTQKSGEITTQKTQKVKLENTSWNVMSILDEDYRPKTNKFEDLATLANIKFLTGGRIENGGTWKLVGSKLTMQNFTLNNKSIKTVTLTLKNNTAEGTGRLVNQKINRPFKLVKM